jgi:predicted cupin superfamily sugar epimerase
MSLSHNHKQTADVTADAIRNLLKLEPNATCGFVRETYRSALSTAPGGLPAPFAGNQALGSALYFMVTPAAPVKLHRIKNDQLYHYYLRDPIEVRMLHAGGTHGLVTVGSDLRAGQITPSVVTPSSGIIAAPKPSPSLTPSTLRDGSLASSRNPPMPGPSVGATEFS